MQKPLCVYFFEPSSSLLFHESVKHILNRYGLDIFFTVVSFGDSLSRSGECFWFFGSHFSFWSKKCPEIPGGKQNQRR